MHLDVVESIFSSPCPILKTVEGGEKAANALTFLNAFSPLSMELCQAKGNI